MIHPRAIREFLKTPRDSHVWVKDFSSRQLETALDGCGFRPASKAPLDTHQLACILLGLAFPRFSFWLDMGLGKTVIVLELLSHFWREGRVRRALIGCASDPNVFGWEEEIHKWGFKIPYATVGNSPTDEKWQIVAEIGAGLIIVTYPGINHMFARREKAKKGSGKCRMKHDLKKIDRFAANLDAFVADQSVHLGNQQSLVFKTCRRLSRNCFASYAMAGIPFGLDPALLWSQQFIVDRGETFGETLGIFRGAFFTEKKNYFGGYDFKFRKGCEEQVNRMAQHRSICYTTSECRDLPPVTRIPRKITLPSNMYAYFEQYMEQLKEARGDRQKTENIFLRMRQLSSGFIGYKNDETGERAQIVFPENPKLDDLVDLVLEMPADAKFVIFYEFTFSGRTIVDRFAKKGIKAGWLWSGTKDQRGLKQAFDREPPQKMKGLVVNHFLGSEALNLQRANYMHFFETPVSVIRRKEAEKRCFRTGQAIPGFMYDYLTTPTDRRILEFHRTGESLFKALLRDPVKALKKEPIKWLAKKPMAWPA